MSLTQNFNPQTFNPDWITIGIVENTIQYMEDFGFYLCDKPNFNNPYFGQPQGNAVTVSQIRNIFGEIKRILASSEKDEWQIDFLLLRTKIAYNVARVIEKNQNSRIRIFGEILEKAHKSVDLSHKDVVAQLRRFSQFLEGIVAYHKVFGGKDHSKR